MNLVLILLLLSIIHEFTVNNYEFCCENRGGCRLIGKKSHAIDENRLHGNCFDLDRPLKVLFDLDRPMKK
jgi:hypothetical protein